MKRNTLPCASIFLAFVLLAVRSGQAATIVWTNTAATGNWSVAANWNPNQVPGPADTAVLAGLGNNSYAVTLDVPGSVSNLTVGASSGTSTQTFSTGAQTLTVNGVIQVNSQGACNVNGGEMAGTVVLAGTLTAGANSTLTGIMTVSNNGVLNLAAAGGNLFFNALTLTNKGTVSWTNTSLYGGVGTLIYNYGLWDAQSDDIFEGNFNGNPATVFDNFGTFRKSGNTGTTTLEPPFTLVNTGTVDVRSGLLSVDSLNSTGGVFTGSGVTQMTSGTAIINGSIISSNLTLAGGTMTGTNVLTGTLTLTAGTLTGVMTVGNNGALKIAANSGNLFFNALTLTNNGTVSWTNTPLYSGVGTLIYNYGLWDAQSDDSFYGNYNGVPVTVFDNFGTLRKSGNTGSTILQPPFTLNNTGTVDVRSGLLSVDSLNSTSGAFTGGGVTQMTSGTAVLNGSIISSNLNLAGGVLTGTNVLEGTMTVSGGYLEGTMTVSNNSVLNFSTDGGNLFFAGLTLTNQGTVNWTNSPIYSGYDTPCFIYNYGLWDAQSDDTLVGGYTGGSTLFDNFGTLRKSGNAGTTDLDAGVTLNNTGLVNVQQGALLVGGSGTNSGSGSFTTATGATNEFAGAYTFAGSTTFSGGGAVVFADGATFTGTITGSNLQMLDGIFAGTNVLVGTLTVSGGYLESTTTVSNNSVLNLSTDAGNLFFAALTLTNQGTVNWTNSPIYAGYGTQCFIYNYGLWDAQSDNTLEGGYAGGATMFDNFGTFRKSGNAGTTTLDAGVTLNNTGLVNVQQGTLLLGGTGTNSGSGSFTTATGATLDFASEYIFVNGPVFSGGGNVVLGGGATVNGTITGSNLQLTGGIFNGTNVLAGTLNVSGGYLEGTMTVSSNSVLNLSTANGNLFFAELTLTNQGTVNWTNSPIYAGYGTQCFIYNYGLWDAQSDDTFEGGYAGGATVFDNFGTFRKSGTTGGNTTLDAGVLFTNTGTLDTQIGLLDLNTYDLTGGTLNFGISGLTTFGVINLAGSPAPLTGAISGNFNSNYIPMVGNSFLVINFSSSSGVFTSTNLPQAAVWQTAYDPSDVTITVLKLVPQFTWANPADIVYGTTLGGTQLDAIASSPTNLGGSLAGTLTYTPPLGTLLFASNNQTLSVTFAPADSATYTNVTTNVTVNVQRRPVILTGTRTYDATTAAASTILSVVNIVGGDVVNAASGSATLAAATVGAESITSGGSLVLGGAQSANYTPTGAGGSVTITVKNLTMSGLSVPSSKVYNRLTTAVVSGSPGTLQMAEGAGTGSTGDGKPYNVDTVSLTGTATGTYNSKDVATASMVTFAGVSLTGAQANDYSLTIQGPAAATITPATLSISSGITAKAKVYDGTTTAMLSSNNVTLIYIIGSDAVTLNTNGYTATFASPNVANGIAVSVTGLTLAGASAGNYTLTQPATLTANITAATLSISSGITANNKVYDTTTTATLSTNNVVLTPIIGSDTVILNTNGYTATFASPSVANNIAVTVHNLKLSGASAGNYTLAQPAGLTANISAATVSFTLNSVANNKIYDGTTTATFNSNLVHLSGVLSGDTVTLNTNGYSANFASPNAGNNLVVSVTGVALNGASAGNYALAQPLTLTASIATGAVTISSGITVNSKIYDRTTNATLSSNNVILSGVVPGEMMSLNTNNYIASFASAGVGSGIGVHIYFLFLSGPTANNYILILPESLTANITPAPATITSGITANNKFYDHTTTATLSSNSVVLSGGISGDTLSLVTNGYTANFSAATVGNGLAVTVSGLTLSGTGSGNYNLTQPSGLTASILAPSLNVVVSPPNMVLSWPVSASTFVLNRTPSLSSPVSLTPVTSGITVNGTNNTISVNAGSGNQFYILVAP